MTLWNGLPHSRLATRADKELGRLALTLEDLGELLHAGEVVAGEEDIDMWQ
jgi:hypothetical protein